MSTIITDDEYQGLRHALTEIERLLVASEAGRRQAKRDNRAWCKGFHEGMKCATAPLVRRIAKVQEARAEAKAALEALQNAQNGPLLHDSPETGEIPCVRTPDASQAISARPDLSDLYRDPSTAGEW